jgi:hypothetical protein
MAAHRTTFDSVSHTHTVFDDTKPPKTDDPSFCTPASPRGLLEPCAVNAARTVLRGPRHSNAPGLPD